MSPIHLPEAGQRLTAVPRTGRPCHHAFVHTMVVQGLADCHLSLHLHNGGCLYRAQSYCPGPLVTQN